MEQIVAESDTHSVDRNSGVTYRDDASASNYEELDNQLIEHLNRKRRETLFANMNSIAEDEAGEAAESMRQNYNSGHRGSGHSGHNGHNGQRRSGSASGSMNGDRRESGEGGVNSIHVGELETPSRRSSDCDSSNDAKKKSFLSIPILRKKALSTKVEKFTDKITEKNTSDKETLDIPRNSSDRITEEDYHPGSFDSSTS